LVHNFSLIHDDIQDGDRERRHRPTVWALWGKPQAVVAGNAMRSLADMAALELARLEVPLSKALAASHLLSQGYLAMSQGQCLDLSFEGRIEVQTDDYLWMVSHKTGALIRCAMELGALIACENPPWVEDCGACGGLLGLAFQVQDDLLGIWGDEAATGKPVGNDIRRQKKSFPIVYALEVASGRARARLLEVYSRPSPTEQDVQDVLAVLDELRVSAQGREVARLHTDKALQAICKVPLAPWARQELEQLADFICTRQY
jgi:geranylgeranyl diphosphate synthase type I